MSDGSTAPIFNQPNADFRYVAPEFFQTLGLAIRRGRSFTDAERDPRRPRLPLSPTQPQRSGQARIRSANGSVEAFPMNRVSKS